VRKIVLIALVLSLVLVLTLSSAVFAGSPSLTNPGFEAGDLSGWTLTLPSGGSATAVSYYSANNGYGPDYYAPDGSYFALLKTGAADIYTSISQSFSANAGDTISGWAFFDANEEGYFNDNCKVEIKDSLDSVIANLFSADASSVGWYGQTPWTSWSYTFQVTGTYKLQAGVANNLDDEVDAYLGLDLVMDTTAPLVNVEFPTANLAVQDGITLQASASDSSGVAAVSFYIREPDGAQGKIIGPAFEDLAATLNGVTGKWEYNFDTLQLPDGYYLALAKAVDIYNNEGWSAAVPFSIRNWAVIQLLPSTPNSKAGRTMPVKFALRVSPSVDPAQLFVWNDELTIRIYATSNPGVILQTSMFGSGSRNYRIDDNTLYITNFQTSKVPMQYTAEIWRTGKNWLVGSFTFKTVK
jgi:hypothetical protein